MNSSGDLTGKIFKASALLAFFGLLSRLVGLFRDRILASNFGASDILDVYYLSFNLPDLVFNLLVAGAISSAFIPVFIEYQKKKKEEWKLASNFLNVLLVLMAITLFIAYIFTPQIINVIAPGFDQVKTDMAILFTRVMLWSPIIFTISIVVGSVLQIFHRFLMFAIAPIMYNLGIIIGVLYLEPIFGPVGLAEGVVLGALFHLLIQLPAVFKIGFKFKLIFDITSVGLKKIVKLMIPRTIGLAAMQINWIVLTAIATVSIGSVAILNFANNLQYLPIALVGISVAVASFPTLSRDALKKDLTAFTNRVVKTIKNILFIVVPITALFIYLSEDIVRIVLGAGKFGISDISTTAKVLSIFSIGIFAQSVIPFLSRSFYALQDTKTPLISSIISVAVNIILALWLINTYVGTFPIWVLPFSFSVAGILNMTLLISLLGKKVKNINSLKIFGYIASIIIISAVSIFVVYIADNNINLSTENLIDSLINILILGMIGALTYLVISYIFNRNQLRTFTKKRG